MRIERNVIPIVSWLLVTIMCFSSGCIGLSGFQTDDSSWFNTMTVLLAEEENEESGSEENHPRKEAKEVLVPYQFKRSLSVTTAHSKRLLQRSYRSIYLDVLSPPPEA